MSGLVGIELRDVATQTVRDLFVFTLLERIYRYNKALGRSSGLRRVTVIEEAERILQG